MHLPPLETSMLCCKTKTPSPCLKVSMLCRAKSTSQRTNVDSFRLSVTTCPAIFSKSVLLKTRCAQRTSYIAMCATGNIRSFCTVATLDDSCAHVHVQANCTDTFSRHSGDTCYLTCCCRLFMPLTQNHLTHLALLLQSGRGEDQSSAHAAYLEDIIEQLRVQHQQDISKLHQVHSHELQQVRQDCIAQVSSTLNAIIHSILSCCSAGLATKPHTIGIPSWPCAPFYTLYADSAVFSLNWSQRSVCSNCPNHSHRHRKAYGQCLMSFCTLTGSLCHHLCNNKQSFRQWRLDRKGLNVSLACQVLLEMSPVLSKQ